MFCKHCGSAIDNGSLFCASCGLKLDGEVNAKNPLSNKPIAGIVVAIVFGSINILWSSYSLINDLSGNVGTIDIMLSGLFPHYIASKLIGQFALLILSTIIIIGALLSFFQHPKGNKLVKLICWVTIVYMIIFVSIDYILITTSDNWVKLSQVLKSTLIGGIIGGLIGGALPNILILFLFRKSH